MLCFDICGRLLLPEHLSLALCSQSEERLDIFFHFPFLQKISVPDTTNIKVTLKQVTLYKNTHKDKSDIFSALEIDHQYNFLEDTLSNENYHLLENIKTTSYLIKQSFNDFIQCQRI